MNAKLKGRNLNFHRHGVRYHAGDRNSRLRCEFLISGITPEEWAATFGTGEED